MICSEPIVPIVANTSAEPITDKNLVRNELKNQLQNCVLWSDSIEYMIDQDVDTFYEIGPGSVLSGGWHPATPCRKHLESHGQAR